ncbi:MAG: MerR family transcriptional regulator, partial [Cyclobacteriaceae bacterium]|nr:MerR family transcriptional regulator [Cyclobacteriaceae bacterium]
MSYYSIKEIEELSGIKAHTLRIWEQRYSFIEPKRTDTNIRYYDDEDLKLILNIALLKNNGHKISMICTMDEKDLLYEVKQLMEKKLGFPGQIQGLTLAMLELDEDRFEKILSTNILQIGFERTMLNLIYPFFQKIGILWQTGAITPAQEHFISNLVRQKIIVAIDGIVDKLNVDAKSFLLFLPEGEYHELGLMYHHYLLRKYNHKVYYLGETVPFNGLVEISKLKNIDYLLTYFVTAIPEEEA